MVKRILSAMLGLFALASCSSPQANMASNKVNTQVVEETIMARRSIRRYTPQSIARPVLDSILQCGIAAPNGKGIQAYEVRVVDNRQLLADLSQAVLNDNPGMSLPGNADNLFFGAPCVVFLGHQLSYDMSQVDCGLLAENIILSAWTRGIGSCCLAHPVRLMKNSPSCAPYIERLGFSEGFELILGIAMGYPDENPKPRARNTDRVKYVE